MAETSQAKQTGTVYLVGAGPGAADLITVRGARLLASANIVLHDALVTPEMLELCPQAIKISVGKRSGKRSAAQAEINQQIVQAAQEHQNSRATKRRRPYAVWPCR